MFIPRQSLVALAMSALVSSGILGCNCCHKAAPCENDPVYAPLGTISDPIYRQMEANAEASDFVIHEHEFEGNSVHLNPLGENHLKQIAARLGNVPFYVLVEPSSMSAKEDTKYKFPIHGNEDLDRRRRQVVVAALEQMGIAGANDRVITSPPLTPGFQQFEGERAYSRGFGLNNGYGGGYGGFGGGFGGGLGGFGGF